MNKGLSIVLQSSLLCGCIAGGGLYSPRPLAEPSPVPFNARCVFASVDRTAVVPVSFKMIGKNTSCAVTRMNAIGEMVSEAVFFSGEIVAREFERVVRSNFHIAAENETADAMFTVDIERSTARVSKGGDSVDATLSVRVTITGVDGSEPCYANVFDCNAHDIWCDRNAVPTAFYRTLETVIAAFVDDLDSSGAVSRIVRLHRKANPEYEQPSLQKIVWSRSGDAWVGVCEVKCNGREGFDAKAWANTHIAVACRIKLGNIEPERVRVVYDEEDFDERSGEWRFVFRTFPRMKMALSYDSITMQGVITGDLELMSAGTVERASEMLKEYVVRKMESHGRMVTELSQRHEVGLRFDDFNTDKTYNLITIRFRLVQ